MITYTHALAGETVTVRMPEWDSDLRGFEAFLAKGDKLIGFDTETTGLGVYEPGFELRLCQFGNRYEAWVLRADLFSRHIARALRADRRFVVHNAAFDLQVLDRHLGVTIEELGPRCYDTRILAHLLDPRAKQEGGIGHGLKDLSAVYVDADAPDTSEDLTAVFRSLKLTKSTGWAGIPIDHEMYVRYAGLDPILARRLFDEIGPLVRDVELDHLSVFEHHLQLLLAIMQRRGMLLDVDYVRRLRGDLAREAEEFAGEAKRYGVENTNSTKQVAEALAAMGETLRERTPSGAVKVDKSVLMALADLDQQWDRIGAREPNPLANAVLHAKRASKWDTAYAAAFLELKDDADRIHPFIGGLQARTARMSISRPPLQQLPSGDWKIRRALIADPGNLIVAADYSQVEMRVLAALCRDPKLLEAILSGEDLHDFTARLVFGPDFTKAQRRLSKMIGFGKVYGGGATTIQRQTGAPMDAVREAVAAYDATYPGIKRYGQRLMRRAEFGKREVITPSGRHLPLDKDRLYSATNYVVQSTARDILAQAIVDLFDAGLGDHLLLPVHDELVAQAPAADAEEIVREIGRVMDGPFDPYRDGVSVPIVSDPEVYGRSWAGGYGVPAELEAV